MGLDDRSRFLTVVFLHIIVLILLKLTTMVRRLTITAVIHYSWSFCLSQQYLLSPIYRDQLHAGDIKNMEVCVLAVYSAVLLCVLHFLQIRYQLALNWKVGLHHCRVFKKEGGSILFSDWLFFIDRLMVRSAVSLSSSNTKLATVNLKSLTSNDSPIFLWFNICKVLQFAFCFGFILSNYKLIRNEKQCYKKQNKKCYKNNFLHSRNWIRGDGFTNSIMLRCVEKSKSFLWA